MRYAWLTCLVAVLTVGCGANKSMKSEMKAAAAKEARAEAKQDAPPTAETIRRKIVYRATVELVVEDFSPVEAEVKALVERFEAYLAESNVSGTPGNPRSGRWKIRVPADRYDDFLRATAELGEVHRVGTDSQDVTEEFYDVEARLRNKKLEETRLLKLLDNATGKLEEVLAVEREISRVRGEIEQLEGRMRVLDNLTTLATVELRIDEIKNYLPEEGATYATRVRRALRGSTAALATTAEQLSIAAVAISPWAGVLVVLLLPAAVWIRARRRRRARQKAGSSGGLAG
jgi:hypothetical protein